MKKSAILINLARATFVVLAYQQLAHPKGGLIPPGTGRTSFQYLKSCYHISKSWMKGLVKRRPRNISERTGSNAGVNSVQIQCSAGAEP